MPQLVAFTPPQDLPAHMVDYLTKDEHARGEFDPKGIIYVTDADTAEITPEERRGKTLISMAVDFQQAATPVSVYARLMVRIERPNAPQVAGLDPDPVYKAFRLAYHLRRYALTHDDVISCDIDAAPSMTIDGTRQYAYMVLLLTVPLT